jgi:hypothetical protein
MRIISHVMSQFGKRTVLIYHVYFFQFLIDEEILASDDVFVLKGFDDTVLLLYLV